MKKLSHLRAVLCLAIVATLPAVVFCLVLLLFSAAPLWAATLTVANTNDSGVGSLRQAIASASPGDTINFSLTYPATITLTSGELLISKNLTISGPGASNLAISGNKSSRVFNIGSVTVAISNLTIQNGRGSPGGGILNGGTLTVTNSTVSDNWATAYSRGGGIFNYGTLTVTNSTLSGNYAHAYGGGICNNGGTATVTNSTLSGNYTTYNGGGISNDPGGTLTVTNSTLSGNTSLLMGGGISCSGTVTVSNSTLSGNSATWWFGGGIDNAGTLTVTNSTLSGNSTNGYGGGISNQPGGTMTVTNSTLSGNSAILYGGGIFNNYGTLTAKNSIVANSPGGGNCYGGGGTLASQDHNLSDDTTCTNFFNQTGDLNSTPAGLDPSGLQNNGGPTKTIALLPTSPAVDAIPVSDCTDVAGNPVTTDQRGVARPQPPGSNCDIGAFELGSPYAAQVQQPINPDGSSVFSVKRGVVPVKFTLTLNGVAMCNLPPATISLIRTAGATPGSVDESVYLSPSDSGSNFRIDTTNCQYVYNLGTSSLGTGTYQVNISIGGTVVGSGTFGLR